MNFILKILELLKSFFISGVLNIYVSFNISAHFIQFLSKLLELMNQKNQEFKPNTSKGTYKIYLPQIDNAQPCAKQILPFS